MATLAKNLRKYVESKEKNVTQFAGKCGMNVSTVSNYLNGTRLPDATALFKIFEVAPDLSADYLFGRDVPMLLSESNRVISKPKSDDEIGENCDKSILLKHIQSQQELIDRLLKTLSDREELIKVLVSKK